MGFIHAAECEIMTNSALINIHMINAAADAGVGRYFFSSSACVYRDQVIGDNYLTEDDAYPALPDNEYGWEKLYAERMALAYGRHRDIEVRVARFQNCFGPYGTWDGGREKAPAAICRKVAMAEDGGTIEVWGDGSALRVYTYVADLCSGIYTLMHSDIRGARQHRQRGDRLGDRAGTHGRGVAGKEIHIQSIEGPVGVLARYHTVDRMKSTGWSAVLDAARRDRGHLSVDRRAGAPLRARAGHLRRCPAERCPRERQSGWRGNRASQSSES